MTGAGIICILSSFEMFVVVAMVGGIYELFGHVFMFAFFFLGITLLVLGAWRFRKTKEKAKMGFLREGETKRNPGLAIVLSFFFCGLGQLYNGQILKGILYLFFYGNFWYLAMWSRTPQKSTFAFWFNLSLLVPPIILWVQGMTDAGRTARRINVQLDYLVQTPNSQSFKTDLGNEAINLCVSCWLSDDCERKKKTIKERKVITDCPGYFTENR